MSEAVGAQDVGRSTIPNRPLSWCSVFNTLTRHCSLNFVRQLMEVAIGLRCFSVVLLDKAAMAPGQGNSS